MLSYCTYKSAILNVSFINDLRTAALFYRILGSMHFGDVRDASPSPAIFNRDKYNFFIVSNLFNDNNLNALSTQRWKCANKINHIFGEELRITAKKFALKIVQKALK